MASHNTLQGTYLNDLRKQRMSVQIYLTSGVRLTGTIESFDQYVLMLKHGRETQLVYKHMITSILPAPRKLRAMAAPNTEHAIHPAEPPSSPVIVRKLARRTLVRQVE